MAGDGIDTAGQLIRQLAECLATPLVRSGMRLTSERDLAARLDLPRGEVRRAFDELVHRGILTRRQGSGTFVRKVPHARGSTAEPERRNTLLEMIFPDFEPPADPIGQSVRPHRSMGLNLVLWSDWQDALPTHQPKLSAMLEHVQQLGHQLHLCSFSTPRGNLPPQAIRQKNRDLRADGCLVVTACAMQASIHPREAFDEAPALFVGGREVFSEYEPAVLNDTSAATRRAITQLAGQGYQRIALLAIPATGMEEVPDQRVYEQTLRDLGLGYRRSTISPIDPFKAMAATESLLAGPNPPEALYIADDYLVAGASEAFDRLGLTPGVDIGVIVLSNCGVGLPSRWAWSTMEFDPVTLTRLSVDRLVDMIQTSDALQNSVSLHAVWKPARTHAPPATPTAARTNLAYQFTEHGPS